MVGQAGATGITCILSPLNLIYVLVHSDPPFRTIPFHRPNREEPGNKGGDAEYGKEPAIPDCLDQRIRYGTSDATECISYEVIQGHAITGFARHELRQHCGDGGKDPAKM